MVKVVDKHGRMYSFQGAETMAVSTDGVLMLRSDDKSPGSSSVALFAAENWQWATRIAPRPQEVPGVWEGPTTG